MAADQKVAVIRVRRSGGPLTLRMTCSAARLVAVVELTGRQDRFGFGCGLRFAKSNATARKTQTDNKFSYAICPWHSASSGASSV